MKKHYFFMLALVCIPQISAVFNETLDEFIFRMTPDIKEQEGFRAYYSNFLDRQSRLSVARKQKRLRRLRMDGLSSLEIKNKKYYNLLAQNKQTDVDNQQRETRLFLVRYRLFEDYQQHKNVRHVYFLNRAQTVLSDLGSKVGSFFSSVKNTVMS